MPKNIMLPELWRGAQVRAESYDEQANTIEVVFTAGATVRRVSWRDGEFDEELIVSDEAVRLDRLNAGAPFLDTHSSWSLGDVIGSVVSGSARIEAGLGIATIQLSPTETDADKVEKIRRGIIRSISVGYRTHRVEIEERDGAVPLHRAIDWEPYEISAVPIPADPSAQVRNGKEDSSPLLTSCLVVPVGASAELLGNYAARARMRMRDRATSIGGQ